MENFIQNIEVSFNYNGTNVTIDFNSESVSKFEDGTWAAAFALDVPMLFVRMYGTLDEAGIYCADGSVTVMYTENDESKYAENVKVKELV